MARAQIGLRFQLDAIGGEVAVREHHALGLAGGAGGVEDEGGIGKRGLAVRHWGAGEGKGRRQGHGDYRAGQAIDHGGDLIPD